MFILASTKALLLKAYSNKYAVGAFNVYNLETVQAVISGAEKLNSPVILQTSEGAVNYAGINVLSSLVKLVADKSKIPVALHLDHGKDLEVIKQAIIQGYNSVMIDASDKNFEDNVRITRRVVELAHKKNVSVEAELGTIGGKEDSIKSKIQLTDPEQARDFVERTGIDFLAVAIGTSHGAYKFKGMAKLDIGRLKEINNLCRIPLVLHGGSQVPGWVVKQAGRYGARLEKSQGVPDSQVKQAISNGVVKINTDTDLRIAFSAGLRKYLKENSSSIDIRGLLSSGKQVMQKIVEHRINVFKR